MNKKDLVSKIADEAGLLQKDARKFLSILLNFSEKALHIRIEISSKYKFCNFLLNWYLLQINPLQQALELR